MSLALCLAWPMEAGAARMTLRTLDHPNGVNTELVGVDASGIAGSYVRQTLPWRAFHWNGTDFISVSQPGAIQTLASGTSGGKVVGRYQYVQVGQAPDEWRAYFWNGSSSTDLIPPGADRDVYAVGVSGNLVVGYYRDAATHVHGFLWNGSAYTSFDALGSLGTWPRAISGNHIAGDVVNVVSGVTVQSGFYGDGTTFTPVMPPGARATWVTGVHGSNVVGTYDMDNMSHGFIWNGSTYVTFDPPGSTGTAPTAVFEDNVVGYYYEGADRHGFLWDGSSFTILDAPGATITLATGIWGKTIVGSYYDAQNIKHGFVTVIPEPSFEIRIGSTNVFAGARGSVPLEVTSGANVTNLSVILEVAETRLTNLVLHASTPEVVSAQLFWLAPDHVRFSLALDPLLGKSGTRELAQLGFLSISNGYSAVVPLQLSHQAGTLVGGKNVANARVAAGRVIVVDQRPVLAVGDPPWMSVVLYGYPGGIYDLETTTNLDHPSWQFRRNVTLSGPFLPIPELGINGPSSFYRAVQR